MCLSWEVGEAAPLTWMHDNAARHTAYFIRSPKGELNFLLKQYQMREFIRLTGNAMWRPACSCPRGLSVILAYRDDLPAGFMIENKPIGGRETATGLLAFTRVSQEISRCLGGTIKQLIGVELCALFLISVMISFTVYGHDQWWKWPRFTGGP